MKVSELIKSLNAKVYTGQEISDQKEIDGCFIGDLLSLAMAKVEEKNIWITIQTNVNIVAVASLADCGCIIIADGFLPDENTVEKAKQQDVIILGSDLSVYGVAKKLAELKI